LSEWNIKVFISVKSHTDYLLDKTGLYM